MNKITQSSDFMVFLRLHTLLFFKPMMNKYSKYFPAQENTNFEDFPYYWIAQVNNLYINKMDSSLKKYGLDNSRRRILLAAAACPNSSISDLAELTVIKIPTTTKIVYRLKEEGLLETIACEMDSRITRVHLTDEGMNMVAKINEITAVLFNGCFAGIKPSEIKKLNEILIKLKNNLS